MDGKMIDEPLATIGLNRDWLNVELEKLGVAVENVFIGQVDTYGQLFVDLLDDNIRCHSKKRRPSICHTQEMRSGFGVLWTYD